MKKLALLLFMFSYAVAQSTAPAKPATGGSAAAAKPAAVSSAAKLPTKDEVDSFLRHMFAGQSNASWTVQEIKSVADIPGVADVAIVFGGAAAATHLYVLPGGHYIVDKAQLLPFGADPFAKDRVRLQKDATGPARGAEKPDALIVVFSDLECPHCKLAEPVLDRLVKDMPNIRLVYQHMPLPMHKWAFKAAQYAECVNQQDNKAFWPFIDSVFGAQAGMKDEDPADQKLLELSAAAGVDIAKVSACVNGGNSRLAVQKSYDLGQDLGVGGTPTVFINGRPVPGVGSPELPYERLKALVEAEILMLKK